MLRWERLLIANATGAHCAAACSIGAAHGMGACSHPAATLHAACLRDALISGLAWDE